MACWPVSSTSPALWTNATARYRARLVTLIALASAVTSTVKSFAAPSAWTADTAAGVLGLALPAVPVNTSTLPASALASAPAGGLGLVVLDRVTVRPGLGLPVLALG